METDIGKEGAWLSIYDSEEIDLEAILADLEDREILKGFQEWYDMFFGENGIVESKKPEAIKNTATALEDVRNWVKNQIDEAVLTQCAAC